MKILVTGGLGFIGSNIVDSLVELGHQVNVIDNLSTGHTCNSNPNVQYHLVDVLDENIHNVFKSFHPDIVIHHAAQIDVQHSLQAPLFDLSVNIIGTLKILECCKHFGIHKIIYASSAAVYGAPIYIPIDEEHPIAPLSFYGISKNTPEHYIKVYSNLYNFNYTVLRYANVYGVRQDSRGEGGVISTFIDKLQKNQSPTIHGTGKQTRDFIYIKDVVNANIAALELGNNSTYNISSGTQTSVLELYQLIKEVLGNETMPEFSPARKGDIAHSCLNNEKAIRDLTWKPLYTLKDGLTETCSYLENKII